MFNNSNGNFQPPYWMNASNNMQTDTSGIAPFTNMSPYYGNPVPTTPTLSDTVEMAKNYNRPIIKGGSDVPVAQVTPYQAPQDNIPVLSPVPPVQPVVKTPVQQSKPVPVTPQIKTVDQVIKPPVTPLRDIPVEAGWGDRLADTMIELSRGKTYNQNKRLLKDFVDCSSLVARSFQQLGLPVPDSTVTANFATQLLKLKYSKVGTASARDYDTKDLRRGDILLFPSAPGIDGHIMVYNGDGNVVEANGWKGKSHVGINPWNSNFHNKSKQYQVWRR